MLRIGDVNSDGFPDLLITLYNSKIPNSAKSYLYLNSDCNGLEICKLSDNKRYFQKSDSFSNKISEKNSSFSSFIDIGDTGFLIVYKKNFKHI